MGVDPLRVMAWEESAWYCQHWDVPRISKWNECIDWMWRCTWHKKNNEHLKFIKGCTKDPLVERIVELEEADRIILDLLPSPGSSSGGGPPLSDLSDIFRNATLGEEAKLEVA